jgi:hypothetical protein
VASGSEASLAVGGRAAAVCGRVATPSTVPKATTAVSADVPTPAPAPTPTPTSLPVTKEVPSAVQAVQALADGPGNPAAVEATPVAVPARTPAAVSSGTPAPPLWLPAATVCESPVRAAAADNTAAIALGAMLAAALAVRCGLDDLARASVALWWGAALCRYDGGTVGIAAPEAGTHRRGGGGPRGVRRDARREECSGTCQGHGWCPPETGGPGVAVSGRLGSVWSALPHGCARCDGLSQLARQRALVVTGDGVGVRACGHGSHARGHCLGVFHEDGSMLGHVGAGGCVRVAERGGGGRAVASFAGLCAVNCACIAWGMVHLCVRCARQCEMYVGARLQLSHRKARPWQSWLAAPQQEPWTPPRSGSHSARPGRLPRCQFAAKT